MKHDLIIIGGGASGLMAAIIAKDSGYDAAIIESKDRIGKKLLSTGNGRCNISNENISFERYHSKNNMFFKPVLEGFSVKDTVNFFKGIGLPLTTLENNKIFPLSLQASSVLDILRLSLDEKNIPVYLNTKVSEIKKTSDKFKIITNTESEFICNKLILCTGGKSAPKTGSDGSGYNLVKKLGHNVITPIPALVQLKLNFPKLKALSGVKFNGTAGIYVNNKLKRKEFGEILFTDYGISGPPILQLSRTASYALESKNKVTLKINIINEFASKDLEEFIQNHWGTFGYRSISNSLIGIINKKLIPVLLKQAKVDNIHKPCWDLTWEEQKNILNLLTEWEFEVINTNGFNNAQVTAGGINTLEVNPYTLESKIIPDLYFCGEILDVDGDCGGFNLQWSWSSAYAASKSACKKRCV